MFNELRNQLARYLNREISFRDFKGWFIAASLNLHSADDPNFRVLAAEIMLRLAEYSAGHLADDKLRAKLQSALGEVVIDERINRPIVRARSYSGFASRDIAIPA